METFEKMLKEKAKFTVMHSECAMHMRIAGKVIVAIRFVYASPFMADVWIEGQDPYQDVAYTALISELVPFELRPLQNTVGQCGKIIDLRTRKEQT